jgi:hypothetical protein
VGELEGHPQPTLEAVTFAITHREDDAPIDGGMPAPRYP